MVGVRYFPASEMLPAIFAEPCTNQTTGAREGWFENVTVAPAAMLTEEYLKTMAHLLES